jgi:flagellar basal-body rod protein FlgC
MFRALDISTSGLVAQRQRLNTVAENIANAQTTRNEQGEVSPYQRRLVRFHTEPASPGEGEATRGSAVGFTVETDTQTPPKKMYSPGHPDADPEGYVMMPAVDLVNEFVNALEASRAYEANVTALEMSKTMSQLSMRILA